VRTKGKGSGKITPALIDQRMEGVRKGIWPRPQGLTGRKKRKIEEKGVDLRVLLESKISFLTGQHPAHSSRMKCGGLLKSRKSGKPKRTVADRSRSTQKKSSPGRDCSFA